MCPLYNIFTFPPFSVVVCLINITSHSKIYQKKEWYDEIIALAKTTSRKRLGSKSLEETREAGAKEIIFIYVLLLQWQLLWRGKYW